MKDLLAIASVTVWIALSIAAPASAHAFLERADPRVGSTVTTPPTEVRLWFTDRLDPQTSSIRVIDQAGQQVDNHDSGVDHADPALLRVSLPALTVGQYRVVWRVGSPDGQVTTGEFLFRIGQ